MLYKTFCLAPLLLALLGACSGPLTQAPERTATLTPQFGTSSFDSASDVAVGLYGNVYVSGGFGDDAFTRRYSTAGGLLSDVKSATPGFDITRAVAVGDDGFVYRVTQYEGSGTGTDTEIRKSAASLHYFAWQRSVASSGSDVAYGVAVDAGNNVYVAGFTTGALAGSNLGSLDAFIRKYSPLGEVLWTRQFGTSGVDTANGVAVRGTSEVYLVGTYDYSASDQDGFIRKYDGLGNVTWTKLFGGSLTELVDGVSVDTLGNVYLAGATSSSLHAANRGGYDAFVRKYTPGGTLTWGGQFGTTGSDYVQKIATPSDGALYVVGRSSGPLAGSSSGSTDAFLRKMSRDGEPMWTR